MGEPHDCRGCTGAWVSPVSKLLHLGIPPVQEIIGPHIPQKDEGVLLGQLVPVTELYDLTRVPVGYRPCSRSWTIPPFALHYTNFGGPYPGLFENIFTFPKTYTLLQAKIDRQSKHMTSGRLFSQSRNVKSEASESMHFSRCSRRAVFKAFIMSSRMRASQMVQSERSKVISSLAHRSVSVICSINNLSGDTRGHWR